MGTLDTRSITVKGKRRVITGPNRSLKLRLAERGLTYSDIARLAGVSWHMVWAVINERKTSAPVVSAIHKLLGGVHASR